MSISYYAGVVIYGDEWNITVLKSDSFEVVHHANVKDASSGAGDSSNLESRIREFIFQQFSACKFDGSGSTVHLVVAIDHLFENGEEFSGTLRDSLSNMLKAELSNKSLTVHINVSPLDASAYLGLFQGVVLKADGCVSIATSDDKGKILAISERGHMIGDPGSAYWIANKCLRMIYDNADGIELTDHNVSAATKAANEYFQLGNQLDILKPLYSDFSKQRITLFCDRLAKLAEQGDAFSKYLFSEAGKKLAHLIKALFLQAQKEQTTIKMTKRGECLRLLGVGRVWNHYEFVRDGFLQTVKTEFPPFVHRLEIFQLVGNDDSYAVALLAGKHAGATLSRQLVDYIQDSKLNVIAAEAF